jgi:hypothetical protein
MPAVVVAIEAESTAELVGGGVAELPPEKCADRLRFAG